MNANGIMDRGLRKVDKYSPWPRYYSFKMTPKEQGLFDATVKHSKTYLEFGMGGSTFRALQMSHAKVYSVDSSCEWLAKMRDFWLIRYMELLKELFLFYVDIGPTRNWGNPVEDKKDLFPNYSSAVFNALGNKSFDTVLVDGRFRVACTLQTILRCHANEDLRIMIHDFWKREHYHVVLNYLNPVDRADQLAVFEVKEGIDLNAVREDYERYKCNFA